MVVSFIKDHEAGLVLEPPKHPHITVKKKFKLLDINEDQLIDLLQNKTSLKGVKELKLGDSKDYNSGESKVIEVLNPDVWVKLHTQIIEVIGGHIESRDPHFEGENYWPHVTWKLKSEITLDPEKLKNKVYQIDKLYLIQRIDPVVSRAEIVTVIA